MKLLLLFTLAFLAYSLSPAQTFTQEVNASTGGYYKQINGSLQFTIGEPLIETYSTAQTKLSQGFQQGHYNEEVKLQKMRGWLWNKKQVKK